MKQHRSTRWTTIAMMSALSLSACTDNIDPIELIDDSTHSDEIEALDEPVAAGIERGGQDVTAGQHAGAFPGFNLDIHVDGDDVVLDWSQTGPAPSDQASVLVLRSTSATDLINIDELGPSVEEFLIPSDSSSFVDSGAASHDELTPTYFYRVLVDNIQSAELSTMVLKVTTPAFAGYTKFGLCMLGGPQNASDILNKFGSAVDGVYAWNAQTQSWLSWSPSDGAGSYSDFALNYGGVVAVGFNHSVDPYLSLVGQVPTDEAFEIQNAQGLNLQTLPALYSGPTSSSYWVQDAGFWGVGEWNPQTWSQEWYWGPGYAEIEMKACNPYYFELPPDTCNADSECSGDQFCSFVEEAACGDFISGVCKPTPLDCDPDAPINKVCGCDGNTYLTECFAELAGTGILHDGKCEASNVMTFDNPGATDGFTMTGDWGLYTQTPPSSTFDTVDFGERGYVLGTDGNRASGSTGYGSAGGYEDEDSEVITTPMVFGSTLNFLSWHVDEGGGYYDRKTVEISVDGGETWTQISNCHTGLNTQAYCEFLYIQRSGDDWDDIQLDTSDFDGETGLLRFTYDTLDSCCSFEQGWFIDDIRTNAD